MRRIGFAAVALAGLVAGQASAAVSHEFVQVDNSSVAELSGYVTSDLQITTDTDWTNSQIVISLTSGSIYQDAVGGDTPPSAALFPVIPSVEFDTYVGVLGDTSSATAGAAGDLLPGSTSEFGANGINITWFNTTTTDIGTTAIGRFTLSDDAQGTWQLAHVVNGEPFLKFQDTENQLIVDGQFVPEPTSALALLGLGGLMMAGRRRQA